MYSFEPTEEQQMLMDAARRLASKDLRDAARPADESGELPRAVIDKGWELGIVQSAIPEACGGFGERSAMTNALAVEELGAGDLAGTLAILAPGLLALPIVMAGSEQQKQSLLPKFAEGYRPATAALVEPRYNFDAAALTATATDGGDGWVLNGEKCYVPLADQAEHFLIFAALEGQTQGFVVDKGTPGLAIGEREKNMGLRGLPTFEVRLADCKVPCENRLGGDGGHDPAPIISATRVALGAMAVGLSKAAYEYALAYAKDRTAFGAPVAQRQSIAFMLAEMITEIEAARLLVWEAAWALDQGQPATREAYLAHTLTSDVALMCADRAVQILGGHGYIREHPVEMWLRNARGFPMMEGLAMV